MSIAPLARRRRTSPFLLDLYPGNARQLLSFTGPTGRLQMAEAGLLASVGTNAPRDDHWMRDNLGIRRRTLLLEGQRENTCISSTPQVGGGSGWISEGAGHAITLAAAVAPDGTMSATRVVRTSGHYYYRSGYPAAATTRTASVYVKRSPGSAPGATFQMGVYGYTGSKGTAFRVAGSTITLTDEWQRASVTYTSDADETSLAWMLSSTVVAMGGGAADFYAWGLQIEEAPFPTSFIPTTSVAVTRNAESASIDLASRAPALTTPRQQTFLLDFIEAGQTADVSAHRVLVHLGSLTGGGTNTRAAIYQASGSTGYRVYARKDGTIGSQSSPLPAPPVGSRVRHLWTFGDAGLITLAQSIDGGAEASVNVTLDLVHPWNSPRLWLNSSAAGSETGFAMPFRLRAALGIRDLAYMAQGLPA